MVYVQQKRDTEGWGYIEIRPISCTLPEDTKLKRNQSFMFHRLSVRQSLEEIIKNTHGDCVQRKIRRATREALTYEEGTSESLLRKFYHLLLLTRRRQGLPAQPITWFQNLIACMGDGLTIRVASKSGQPIASIVTLRNKRVLVYKYGCSDQRFNKCGGMQFLYMQAIRECSDKGLWEFDLGRSDRDNRGLIAFKDRWGAVQTELSYFRYPAKSVRPFSETSQARIGKYILSHAPTALLVATGKAIYRHLG
jgi:lipid II:glycine glycyltransferase (peptidoglycan interpeptide bridge formation enzyme)